ncbi:MAG TPA: hypothetical protein VJ508_08055 [Saprospiraceae bacterium]|nr:hypothetical protein [Saprospiraceae bacterium]
MPFTEWKMLKEKLTVELLWWVFTLIVIGIVMLPIWNDVPSFPFTIQNILLIIFFVTFTRYIFFLHLTLIARAKWIKVAIIASALLFLFITATAMIDFRNFMDEQGLQTLVDHLDVEAQTRKMNYIKHEMIFFGVGSLITGFMLPLRMIRSLWRMWNK